ncbi:MAG: ATP-binding cassette domain-containing protein [Blautia marasmi]
MGIIGHTGSGKSTLIQHFNGLMKPTSGTVFYMARISGQIIDRQEQRQGGAGIPVPEHQLFEAEVPRMSALAKESKFSKKKRGEGSRALTQAGLPEKVL